MTIASRNFGIPRHLNRGPVYLPPSKFGDHTICDVVVCPRRPRSHAERRRWAKFRCVAGILSDHIWLRLGQFIVIAGACAMIGFAVVSTWNIYAAWSDHQRACTLPVHSNPSCRG